MNCPMQAISETKSKKAVICERTFEYGDVDFVKCQFGFEGITKKTHGMKDIPVPENLTMTDFRKAREQLDPRQL